MASNTIEILGVKLSRFGEQFGQRTAGFERVCVLQILQLEIEIKAQVQRQARRTHGGREERRALNGVSRV